MRLYLKTKLVVTTFIIKKFLEANQIPYDFRESTLISKEKVAPLIVFHRFAQFTIEKNVYLFEIQRNEFFRGRLHHFGGSQSLCEQNGNRFVFGIFNIFFLHYWFQIEKGLASYYEYDDEAHVVADDAVDVIEKSVMEMDRDFVPKLDRSLDEVEQRVTDLVEEIRRKVVMNDAEKDIVNSVEKYGEEFMMYMDRMSRLRFIVKWMKSRAKQSDRIAKSFETLYPKAQRFREYLKVRRTKLKAICDELEIIAGPGRANRDDCFQKIKNILKPKGPAQPNQRVAQRSSYARATKSAEEFDFEDESTMVDDAAIDEMESEARRMDSKFSAAGKDRRPLQKVEQCLKDGVLDLKETMKLNDTESQTVQKIQLYGGKLSRHINRMSRLKQLAKWLRSNVNDDGRVAKYHDSVSTKIVKVRKLSNTIKSYALDVCDIIDDFMLDNDKGVRMDKTKRTELFRAINDVMHMNLRKAGQKVYAVYNGNDSDSDMGHEIDDIERSVVGMDSSFKPIKRSPEEAEQCVKDGVNMLRTKFVLSKDEEHILVKLDRNGQKLTKLMNRLAKAKRLAKWARKLMKDNGKVAKYYDTAEKAIRAIRKYATMMRSMALEFCETVDMYNVGNTIKGAIGLADSAKRSEFFGQVKDIVGRVGGKVTESSGGMAGAAMKKVGKVTRTAKLKVSDKYRDLLDEYSD